MLVTACQEYIRKLGLSETRVSNEQQKVNTLFKILGQIEQK